jgi:hypothetical protein
VSVHPDKTAIRAVDACGGTYSAEQIASGYAAGHSEALCEAMKAVVDADALAAELLAALTELADVFAREDECSTGRFDRLAEMFYRDTRMMAPGKDRGMGGPDQPDGAELRAIYDAWFAAKVARARAVIAKATGQ